MPAPRVLKDCIYDNFIKVSPLCAQFLDQPEVQRMRHILQLGVVPLVFKDATHSRFAHSVGVMHLAGRMVDVLREHGADVSDREKEMVELAALMHDTGHVAFSHMMDSADYPHETRSVEAVRSINRRIDALAPCEVDAVALMILGTVPPSHPRPFLFQIVANQVCGIDVDRLDYLLRDARATGQPAFQAGYLINHARVDPATQTLAFSRKAVHEIERMFRARNDMFRIVYRHRAVVAAERLALEIIAETGLKINEDWLNLTDPELIVAMKRVPAYSRLISRQWERCEDASGELKHRVIEGRELELALAAVPLV